MFDDNIKVHFAGCDGDAAAYVSLKRAAVNYRLYSCFNFIKSKKVGQDFRLLDNSSVLKEDQEFRHVIQDSGLFTLMFGSGKGTKLDFQYLTDWQDKLISFVKQNGLNVTCVEIDCQKLLGVEAAWVLRERMRKLLPNKQINVFHVEDGKRGLDKLIDFSSYIAISVPELRLVSRGTYKRDVANLARYIKDRKPEIDIHLLGCTELGMLHDNAFCTSADSTSWLSGRRFGQVNLTRYRVDEIRKEIIEARKVDCKKIADDKGVPIRVPRTLERMAEDSISASICKKRYEAAAGGQD